MTFGEWRVEIAMFKGVRKVALLAAEANAAVDSLLEHRLARNVLIVKALNRICVASLKEWLSGSSCYRDS